VWTEQTARLLNSQTRTKHDNPSAQYNEGCDHFGGELSLGCMCRHHVDYSIGKHLVP